MAFHNHIIFINQHERQSMTYTATDVQTVDREQRRMESIIEEFHLLASHAEELGARLSALLDRAGGSRPKACGDTNEPKAVPNGYIENLNAVSRRINAAHEHIRAELTDIERLL